MGFSPDVNNHQLRCKLTYYLIISATYRRSSRDLPAETWLIDRGHFRPALIRFIALITSATIGPRSAGPDGRTISDCPISNRCSSVRLAASAAPMSGRTLIGTRRPNRGPLFELNRAGSRLACSGARCTQNHREDGAEPRRGTRSIRPRRFPSHRPRTHRSASHGNRAASVCGVRGAKNRNDGEKSRDQKGSHFFPPSLSYRPNRRSTLE